jgi:hypothetical protein
MIFLNVFFFRFHIFLCFPYANLFFVGSIAQVRFKKKNKIKNCLPRKITNIYQFHLFFFCFLNLIFIILIVICFVWDHFLDCLYIYSLILKITWVFSSLFICCSLLDLLSLINIKLVENWASWLSLDLGFKGLRV